ncbi:MAG: DUF3140 domain-containing protein [Paracoccaceae bacterium]
MSERNEDERKEIRKDFREAVNMSPQELEDWLATDEAWSVGQGEGESKGHEMGRRIVALRRKSVEDMDKDDHDAMQKVTGYVHRHLKQGGPSKDVEHSKWRYSLMNWGHDPLKD